MNPDRYTPDKALELGLINKQEYNQRMSNPEKDAVEPVYPELYLSGAPAIARSVGGAVAKNVLGKTGQAVNIGTKTPTSLSGVSSNTPGSLRVGTVGSPPVANPTASTAVTNVANTQKSGGQLVVQPGSNVAKTNTQQVVQPGSNVANTQQSGNQLVPGSNVTNKQQPPPFYDQPKIGGPKALNGPKTAGKNDNVIDVDAKDITNRKQIGMNQTQTRDAGDGYATTGDIRLPSDRVNPVDFKTPAAIAAATGIVGGGVYGLQKGLEPRQANTDNQTNPDTQPKTDQTKTKTVGPGSGRGSGQGDFMQGGATAAQLKAQNNKDVAPNKSKFSGLNPQLQPDNKPQVKPADQNDPRLGGSNTSGNTAPVNKSAQSTTTTPVVKNPVVTPTAAEPTFSQGLDKTKIANDKAAIKFGTDQRDAQDKIDIRTDQRARNDKFRSEMPLTPDGTGSDELNDLKSKLPTAVSPNNGNGTISVTPLDVKPDAPSDDTTRMRSLINKVDEPQPDAEPKINSSPIAPSSINQADMDDANSSDDAISSLNATQGWTDRQPSIVAPVPPPEASPVTSKPLEPIVKPAPAEPAPAEPAPPPVVPDTKPEPVKPVEVTPPVNSAPPAKNADDFLSQQQVDKPDQKLSINGQKVDAQTWNASNANALANRSQSEIDLDDFASSAKANAKPVPTKESLVSNNTINTPRYSFLRGL
jgi:hypothetical protein